MQLHSDDFFSEMMYLTSPVSVDIGSIRGFTSTLGFLLPRRVILCRTCGKDFVHGFEMCCVLPVFLTSSCSSVEELGFCVALPNHNVACCIYSRISAYHFYLRAYRHVPSYSSLSVRRN